MTPTDWAGLAVSILTIIAGFAALVRWLVKHYLYELKPNSGSSMSDRLARVENRLDDLYKFLVEKE